MRPLFATLALAGALCAASDAEAGRATRHWGGADFPFSCETVRSWRAQINGMSAATKDELARQFKITRKQRRQAMACLKGRD